MNWIPAIVAAVIAIILIVFYVDWRRDERNAPISRFNGPAPVRFIKHIAMRIADGAFTDI